MRVDAQKNAQLRDRSAPPRHYRGCVEARSHVRNIMGQGGDGQPGGHTMLEGLSLAFTE